MSDSDTKDKVPWTYKSWYDKHGTELSERRRSRYASDPEYKEKVLEQNRKHREKLAKEPRPPKVKKPSKANRSFSRTMPMHGSECNVELHYIGALAKAVNRSVPTVRQWERTGVLPHTPLAMIINPTKEEKLYTTEMINVVKAAVVARHDVITSIDRSFPGDILNGWVSLGIDMDLGIHFKLGDDNG